MITQIHNILTPDELKAIRTVLESSEFVSGKETASGHAAEVKDNLQLDPSQPEPQKVMQTVLNALIRSKPLYRATYPKKAYPPRINRYDVGMSYGNHIDTAVVQLIKESLRKDISVTVFLNAAEEYDGGELVIVASGGEQRIKLPAGSLVAYPSTSLHRIEPVTRGTRFAAITWIQSLVRDLAQRQLLSDMEQSIRQLKERLGGSPELDVLDNCYHNLLRFWVEP